MKKLILILALTMLPSSAFALIGFGIQGGQDMSKLGAYSYSEGFVSINALEMESNPAGIGVYAFVDLFGYALEGEADFAGAEAVEGAAAGATFGAAAFGAGEQEQQQESNSRAAGEQEKQQEQQEEQ